MRKKKLKAEIGKLKGRAGLRTPSAFSLQPSAFTLLELLVVIAIIAILAGLILSTAGYIQKKGAMARAEAEIAALSAALESYKADNGDYPTGTNGSASGNLTPGTNNAFLRAALAPNGSNSYNPLNKVYFEFPKGMGNSSNLSDTNVSVLDPFGEGYGYMYPGNSARNGTNFFDLWSRSGSTNTNAWIKNW
jgi:prepilin-type N-terminal cleavage/methylation domain-containing protein